MKPRGKPALIGKADAHITHRRTTWSENDYHRDEAGRFAPFGITASAAAGYGAKSSWEQRLAGRSVVSRAKQLQSGDKAGARLKTQIAYTHGADALKYRKLRNRWGIAAGVTGAVAGGLQLHHQLREEADRREMGKSLTAPNTDRQRHVANVLSGAAMTEDASALIAGTTLWRRAKKPPTAGLKMAQKAKTLAPYVKDKAMLPMAGVGLGALALNAKLINEKPKQPRKVQP